MDPSISSMEEIGWREISDLARSSQEDVMEHLPPGARVTVLVFREGDQVNLFRVIENDDGSYTPLSESWSGSSIRNLFAEEDAEESNKRLQENSVTMGKMKELQTKMEHLSLQKKPKKTLPNVTTTKKPLLSRRHVSHQHKSTGAEPKEPVKSKSHQSILHLPQINTTDAPTSSLLQAPRSNYLATSSITHFQNPTRNKEYRLSRREKNPEASGHAPYQSGHLPKINKQKYNEKLAQSTSMEGSKSSVGDDSVISASNIAVVDEEGDVDPLNGFPQRVVSSKEATLMTVSQLPVSNVGSGGPYRLSRFVIEDREDRPKTTPDSLTKQQKATQEICDIISETKWHRRQSRVACSSSQLDLSGESHMNFVDGGFVHKEKSTDDSALDVNIRSSPRYGRRSVVVQSTKARRTEEKLPQELYRPTMMNNEERKESRRRLPLPESKPAEKVEPPPKKPAVVRTRCAQCRKRLNITNVYTCRCNQLFCSAHRHCESHQCTFDYKSHGRKLIQAANPVVSAPKLPKI